MKPVLNVVLVDINPKVVQALRAAFADTPEVSVAKGSILAQGVDAWVTPTNAHGSMNGGVDGVIKQHLGAQIERRVQAEIAKQYGGAMPVGSATCVPTGIGAPGYLISTPTMVGPADDVGETLNVAFACAAAFQAIHMQNARSPGSIRSVALPGLGARTGRVSPRACANLMWTGYTLFNDYDFRDFAAMRAVLREQLGDASAAPETTRTRVRVPAPVGDPLDPFTF